MNRVGREEILGRWFNGCSSHTAYEFLWKHYLLIDHKKTCKYRWITHWETKEPYSNNRSLEWHTVTPSEYRERYRKLAHRKPLYLGVECWPFGNMASHLCSLLLDRRKDISSAHGVLALIAFSPSYLPKFSPSVLFVYFPRYLCNFTLCLLPYHLIPKDWHWPPCLLASYLPLLFHLACSARGIFLKHHYCHEGNFLGNI